MLHSFSGTVCMYELLCCCVQGEVKIMGQVRKGLLADDPELASRLKVCAVLPSSFLHAM